MSAAPEANVAETALQLFHERNTHIALLIEAARALPAGEVRQRIEAALRKAGVLR